MKILSLVLLTVAFVSTINAQTKPIEPLSWKAATIDVSTPDDIIAKYGKPEKEGVGTLDVLYTRANTFTQNTNKKDWKVLRYKEIEQVTNVEFCFNKDNRLVFIKFEPPHKDKTKLIDVQAFLKSFENINFKPRQDGLNYVIYGKHPSGYILAEINRRFNVHSIEDVPNDDWDGIVVTVQFVSKSLENNDNTNVLK